MKFKEYLDKQLNEAINDHPENDTKNVNLGDTVRILHSSRKTSRSELEIVIVTEIINKQRLKGRITNGSEIGKIISGFLVSLIKRKDHTNKAK